MSVGTLSHKTDTQASNHSHSQSHNARNSQRKQNSLRLLVCAGAVGSGQWAEARRIELAKGRIQLNTQPGNDAKITKRLQHFVCAALSLVFILCRVRFLSVCGTDCLWHSKVQTPWTTVATMFRPVRLPISPTSTPPPLPTLAALLPSTLAFLICRLSSSIFYNYKHIWPNNGAAERHCNIMCLTPTHNRTHIRFPTLHNKVHSSLKKMI